MDAPDQPSTKSTSAGSMSSDSASPASVSKLPVSELPPASVPKLGLIRTELANERTLLAYGRTGLMLTATGVSLVKFLSTSPDLVLLGWFLIVAGLMVGIVGVKRFTTLKRRLNAQRD